VNIASPQKPPSILAPIVDNIPQELRVIDRWLCWKAEWQAAKGKYNKIPIDALTLTAGSSTNSQTWSSFDAAFNAYRQSGRRLAGIGIALVDTDDLLGIDCDDVMTDDGFIDPITAGWVQRFDTYTEISPSGSGLRLFCRGVLPRNGLKAGKFEAYQSGRYLSATGHVYGELKLIRSCQETLDAFYREFFNRKDHIRQHPYHGAHSTQFDIRRHSSSLDGYHETSRGWGYARCPAHRGDGATSLFIWLQSGAFGCFAGCTTDDIRTALGAPRIVQTRRGAVMSGAFIGRGDKTR
jgi:putative DNA primase/helicase